MLLNTINIPSSRTWSLCYQATSNGFNASTFHAKCDGKNNTLTLIKTTNSFIFGGFTTVDWSGTASYKFDSNAFIFSLANLYGVALKMNVFYSERAILVNPLRGPTFGYGHDFSVYDKSNIANSGSYSNLGYSYKIPFNISLGTVQSQSILAGSNIFVANEIEVYSTDCKHCLIIKI